MERKKLGMGEKAKLLAHLLFVERKVPVTVEWMLKKPYHAVRSRLALTSMKGPLSDLNIFERRVYSQYGDDGIIEAIFKKIGTTNKYFVEFGVEDGKECNTRLLHTKGWTGLQMDGSENDNPLVKKEFITAENINELFAKYKVPSEFDLLSIDIDGNDYWVWKAIKEYSPRVVIVEYNASIPLTEGMTIPYKPDFQWDGSDYFGASLLALLLLGESKGYSLIGCNSSGNNAYFVRDDLLDGNFTAKQVPEAYHEHRVWKKNSARPETLSRMIKV